MFTKQDIKQANIKGTIKDPSYILIESNVKRHLPRIRKLLHTTDRAIGSDNILFRILGSLQGVHRYMSYDEVHWYCRRNLSRIAAGTGCAGPASFGQVHVGNFIKSQDELISLVAEEVDTNQPWEEIASARFLYHPHTNLDWEIGSGEIGRGVALIEVNIVALVWQWIQSLRYFDVADKRKRRPTNKVWVYRYVVYNMLPSYFNLAVFNRHLYSATHERYQVQDKNSVYPVPDLGGFIERHIRMIAMNLRKGDKLPMQLLNNIQLPFPDKNLEYATAMGLVIDIPSKNLLWQHRVIYEIANLYFLKFVMAFRNPAVDNMVPNKRYELNAWLNTRPLSRFSPYISRRLSNDVIEPMVEELAFR